MNSYSIYCTEEQTKTALKLGAPIETYKPIIINSKGGGSFTTPTIETVTAEQMIGWLEEQHVEIDEIATLKTMEGWDYVIYMTGSRSDIENLNGTFSTRREATLAAIDAALDYLSNKKIKFK